jgi:Common central domain of tyrosinase
VTGPPRTRRNIDTLPPGELADYEHALERLRMISESDPESIDGYTYFEQLHDGDKGPCEHANDTFMPWHRAHLVLFEEALRRSDPPRTANVTVPYWDWSALPSGTRYPQAFEREGSILHNPFRNDTPICRTAGAGDCQHLPFPRAYLETEVLSKEKWSTPEALQSRNSFGGFAGGPSDCSSPFGEGFGKLELPAHNDMHGEYVGGDMADPSAAALDPIFFSFHCYIDLLWSQWQAEFETDTDLDAELCGLFKDREHRPENRFRVRDTLNTETQLGYVYEYTPGDVAPAPDGPAEPLFPTHPAIDFVVSARKPPELVRTLDVTVPAPGLKAAQLLFTDVNVATTFSYGADIYLTPAGEELRTTDRGFRERYLADMLYFWKAHHHHGGHGGHTVDLIADLSRALKWLAGAHAGEQWRVSVALAASDSGGHHHDGHEAVTPAAADPATEMDFGDLTLEVE